ncbi:hypothetical protein MTR_5g084910 [Medicago truncatula]|uniref:Uncharacterized protein n=1 Tax=Medicago truncatula TaxID=3880 RepID=G7K7H7_MEDTR|nr:hypothetical protein MTR_5g084910 [Medicago truncatula]
MSKLSLLKCVLYLNPAKSFAVFDVNKLLRMTKFYPNDLIDVPEVTLLLLVATASVEHVFSL